MKKLILSILFIICLSFQASAWNPMVVVSGGGGTEDFSDIVFWINFENYSAAQTYTLHASNDYTAFGDSTATFLNDAEINVGAALQGSYGLDCTDDDSSGSDRISFDMSSGERLAFANKGRIGFYFNIPTDGFINFARLMAVSLDETNELFMQIAVDDELRVWWEESTGSTSGVISTSDSPITETVTYFVEFAWDSTQVNGSDYLEIWVNGVSKASSSELTMTAGNFTPINILIGNSSDAEYKAFIDVVVFSTDINRDLFNLVVTRGIVNYPG